MRWKESGDKIQRRWTRVKEGKNEGWFLAIAILFVEQQDSSSYTTSNGVLEHKSSRAIGGRWSINLLFFCGHNQSVDAAVVEDNKTNTEVNLHEHPGRRTPTP